MNRDIIIDYLNFSSAFKLIKNERGSNVIALFRPESRKVEFLLIKIITLFKMNYSLDKMMSSKLSENIANKVFRSATILTNEISKEYIYNSSSKVNDFFNFNIKSWIFQNLFRQVSIIEYTRKLNISFDALYISTQLNSKLLRRLPFFESVLMRGELVHYKSTNLIDDALYSYRIKRSKIRYSGTNIGKLIEMLHAFLFVKIRIKAKVEKIDVLIFSHYQFKWIGLDEISNNLPLNSKIVYPDGMVGNDTDAFQIKSIYWNEIFLFYKHMIMGVIEFLWSIKININLFSQLLTMWKFIYIQKSLFKKYNIRIILSGYESPISMGAIAVASDNEKMASFDSLWSIGEHPIEFACTQNRVSDRYFIWGRWHHDLMIASNDHSKGHILTGYIGDRHIPSMKAKGKIFRNKHLKTHSKIITIFDSGSGADGHFSEEIYINLVKSIKLIADDFNALVVIKSKKGDSRYADIIKLDNKGFVIDNEKASLVAALSSDVVIGIGSSGPASISAVHGLQTILYDPNKLVWDKWSSYENYCPKVRSLLELQTILRGILSFEITKDMPYPEYIDPYGDYMAQKRMEDYIQNVFDNQV